ncbi:hypothetical protein QBC46DRAFT_374171 [Diplogelasinospora grovesii]|uniref:Thiamine phosphate synthase/TenI domain-containing protein n=1 Tax=Diplogelasinospora grovesii TaxID=303347 RepID=A0AAN6NJA9_9PEZI|nr:hypothetical protein QBC46DRAFT_374171 [Diplogelasinospora grovesii]
MGKPSVDYSLYLVTDSTPAILGDRDLCDVVEAAVRGGVTCVQFRDKTSSTGDLIATARRLHAVTQQYNVPLLINDRADVALAVGCEGVHIGQDDLELPLARKLLGPDAIIGVTVSTIDEALRACEDGADYLGIGTVYATSTKKDTKNIIGTAGVRRILEATHAIRSKSDKVRAVCIGGINESNVQRILYQTRLGFNRLDGVAVVSAIVAAENPEAAAQRLCNLIAMPPPFKTGQYIASPSEAHGIVEQVPKIIRAVHAATPLSHNMTNLVVQNFAANVALAMGASPIMANYGEEAPDLCKLGGSLVINMGTVTPDGLANYVKALKAYNQAGGPVVLDPVGAGATSVRRSAVKAIMAAGYLDVIKGNEGEIKTVWFSGETDEAQQQHQQEQQRGVDSSNTLDDEQKAWLVSRLALRERNVVIMTGRSDFVSDGYRTLRIDNGHAYLGMATGTGCVLGTAVSAALAAYRGDKLVAVVAAMLHFEIAAELAAARPDVQGPGTFVPALLDELYRIRQATAEKNDITWLQRAKVVDILEDIDIED